MGRTSRTLVGQSKLVARVARGEPKAFGRLYDEYVETLFRHIYFLVNDSQLAERLTAQTFSYAAEGLGRYETSDGPFLTWLFRIAHELTSNLDAAQRRNDSRLKLGHAPQAKDTSFALNSERTLEGLHGLPADQRQVVVMRFIDGLSEADIATVMGQSVAAVRTIQYRALLALEPILKD